MKQANDILDELRSWNSPLADMSRTMPYAIPAGYFEALPKQILGLALGSDEQQIPLGKDMPYDMPGNYFGTLPDAMLAAAKGEAMKLPKGMPHIVPEGYFDQFQEQLLDAIEKAKEAYAPKQTKTIPLGHNIWKQVRWAAAALMVMGIGISSYIAFTPKTLTTEQQLAQLPGGTINEYVQNNIDEFDAEMLAEAMANTGTVTTVEQLSDEDIINYLNETGWENEATIN